MTRPAGSTTRSNRSMLRSEERRTAGEQAPGGPAVESDRRPGHRAPRRPAGRPPVAPGRGLGRGPVRSLRERGPGPGRGGARHPHGAGGGRRGRHRLPGRGDRGRHTGAAGYRPGRMRQRLRPQPGPSRQRPRGGHPHPPARPVPPGGEHRRHRADRGGEIAPAQRSLALGNVNLGFDALVNARANTSSRAHTVRYTAAVLRELPAFKAFPYWISIDGGEPADLDATLLTVCNSGTFGGGMRIAPGARLDDGMLDLVTVSGLGRAELLRFFPRVFRGAHTDLEEFEVRSVRTVTVGLRHGRALRAYSDGEPRSLLPVTAAVLPGAVRLLADPAAAGPRKTGDRL